MEALPIHIHFYEKDRYPGYEKEFINILDEAGIQKVVVFANNKPDETPNECIFNLKSEFPDRIIGISEIDLKDKNVLNKMKEYVQKYKMSGFKVFPSRCNCYPDDKKVFPVYQKAIELNVPIVFHSGRIPDEFEKYGLNKFAQPIYLDEVAVRFPELKIVISHSGNPMFEQTLMVGNRSNIYIDVCGVTDRWRDKFKQLYAIYGADRIMHGGPNHDHKLSLKAYVDDMMNVLSEENVDIESRKKIMAQNAKRVFNT